MSAVRGTVKSIITIYALLQYGLLIFWLVLNLILRWNVENYYNVNKFLDE